MSIALIVISDGRDCHERSLTSAADCLPEFDQIVRVSDDSHQLGFAGAIERAWDQVEADWIFHLEADFTFHAPVPVDRMVGVLERNPYLVQLVLKRQPWNEQEIAAGGIVEQNPDDFLERRDDEGNVWTEHRRFWSTNPSVYSAKWVLEGWPQVPHSEGIWTHQLLEDPLLHFGFWGGKFDAPLVHHIGQRTGVGY